MQLIPHFDACSEYIINAGIHLDSQESLDLKVFVPL